MVESRNFIIIDIDSENSSDESVGDSSEKTNSEEIKHAIEGGESSYHLEKRCVHLKGDVNNLLQKNETLRKKLIDKKEREKRADQTLAEYNHMIQDKIKLNLQYKYLENDMQVLTQTQLDLHHSADDPDGDLNRQKVRLQRENQRLRGEVEKLLQKIRMIESTGKPSWVGSAAGVEKAVTEVGKVVSSSCDRQSVRGVTETPCDGSGDGQCIVRVTSQWGVNRDHLIEYTDQFEGLECIDFQGEQATLMFSEPRHAKLFSRKRVHKFRGSVMVVASPEKG